MATNFTQPGHRLTFDATADTVSNDFVVQSAVFGVAMHSAKSGDSLTIGIGGCWELPKASADAPAQFDAAYWSGTEVTTAADDGSGGNYTKIGVFAEPAAASTTSCNVRLNSDF